MALQRSAIVRWGTWFRSIFEVPMNSAHELRTLIAALRQLADTPSAMAAMATLTRTHGSTFRRAGTRMLVLADGSVVCELSGGCPQRDIVLRAQEVIATGVPRLVNYNAESGLDVMMEMGCGGELEVLLEPLATTQSMRFVDALVQCLDERRSARMATVFTAGDTAALPRHLIWCDDDLRLDELDDPALRASILQATGANDATRAVTWRLPSSRGEVDVLVEPITPPHALIVIGSSAAARALLPVASALGWLITLVDNDPLRLQAADLPPALGTVCAGPETVRDALQLDAHSSVVVMTHNLERDIAYIAALRDAPLAYLGALGSHERAGRMRGERVLSGARLHAPAGLDIGSETPTEIALAVAAEIMAVINGRSGGPLRDSQLASIH
jgi:xanthine/CO dehydrogenase XdhC/CoxF family maturation factor